MGLVVLSCWSDTLSTSGAKAEWEPDRGVGTALQPQPPGTQEAMVEVNCPSVPLSKPSVRDVQAILVAVGVAV